MTHSKTKEAILLYADSESNADILYFSKVFVPDPFIAIRIKNKKIAVLNQLEFGRIVKSKAFDKVLSLEDYQATAKKVYKIDKAETQHIIAILAKEYKIKEFTVPDNFPLNLALELKNLGIKLNPSDGPIFPKREIKEKWEAKAIQEGNAAS